MEVSRLQTLTQNCCCCFLTISSALGKHFLKNDNKRFTWLHLTIHYYSREIVHIECETARISISDKTKAVSGEGHQKMSQREKLL